MVVVRSVTQNPISDILRNDLLFKLELLEQIAAVGLATINTSTTSSTSSPDVTAIKTALGQSGDSVATESMIGLLKRVATRLESSKDAELVEYQTVANGPWEAGYMTFDGTPKVYDALGNLVAAIKWRLNTPAAPIQGAIESTFYKSTVASTGIAGAGVLLRQILITQPGATVGAAPVISAPVWQNMATGATLTSPPSNPDKLDDNIEQLLGIANGQTSTISAQVGLLTQLVMEIANRGGDIERSEAKALKGTGSWELLGSDRCASFSIQAIRDDGSKNTDVMFIRHRNSGAIVMRLEPAESANINASTGFKLLTEDYEYNASQGDWCSILVQGV